MSVWQYHNTGQTGWSSAESRRAHVVGGSPSGYEEAFRCSFRTYSVPGARQHPRPNDQCNDVSADHHLNTETGLKYPETVEVRAAILDPQDELPRH